MIDKRVGTLPVVVTAILASSLPGTASTARDRTSGAPRLVRSRRLGRPVRLPFPGRFPTFSWVAWSPDGQRIAAAGSPGVAARIWNATTGKEEHFWDDHRDDVGMVAWRPDGKLLATAGSHGAVRLWDAATGRQESILRQPDPETSQFLACMRWSPDGSRLAVAGLAPGVLIWNTATGGEEARLSLGGLLQIDWSPDGSQLAVATKAAFSPDWKRVDAPIRILDAATWKEQRVFYDQGFVSVVWSPDGKRLASTSRMTTVIRLWDPTTGEPVKDLGGSWLFDRRIGHTHLVQAHEYGHSAMIDRGGLTPYLVGCIAWSPDGRFLASGGADWTVRIWDPAMGEELLRLRGSVGAVNDVAWSPDGRRLASCGDDGVVRVWDLAFRSK